MKSNKWTLCLAAAGVIGLNPGMHAEEAPSNLLTALSSTTLSGYVSFSAVWNPAKNDGAIPGLVQNVGGKQYQDGFNLDVVSLTLDKPLTDDAWSAGYHVQMLMGPGALQRGSGLSAGGTDFGFNEAYIDVKIPVGNGIELDFGQFGTYNGYEAYDVYKNPNFTKSFGFYNETSAHTGIRATYKFSDVVTFSAAVANTGSALDGFGSSRVDSRAFYQTKKAYLGMLTLTAPESMGFLKGATLSLGGLDGPGNSLTGFPSHSDTQQLYAGGSMPTPVKDLALGFGYDYTALPAGAFLPKGPGYANSIAGYLTYGGIDKLKLNTRVDYGTSSPGWYGGLGLQPERLLSLTETVDYSLWKNVISRVEARYDTSLNSERPYGGALEYKHSLMLVMNLIYQF